jgi:hypothetical protein
LGIFGTGQFSINGKDNLIFFLDGDFTITSVWHQSFQINGGGVISPGIHLGGISLKFLHIRMGGDVGSNLSGIINGLEGSHRGQAQ